MAVVWVTSEDVTPSGTTGWQEIDTATVPNGASGVIVEMINVNTGDERVGLRRADSTDGRNGGAHEESHTWAIIGVDEDGKFDAYRADVNISYWLHGYCQTEFTNFQNGVDHTPGSTGQWTDTDITADTSGDSVAAVFEFEGASNQDIGAQHNDSTDDKFQNTRDHAWFLTGVDSGEVCELYVEGNSDDMFLVGYFTDDITTLTNRTDRTSDLSDGAWADLTALAATASGGIYAFYSFGNDADDEFYGLRENGSSRDVKWCSQTDYALAISKADGSQVCEAFAKTGAGGECFESGFFAAAAAAALIEPSLLHPFAITRAASY